MQEGFRFYALKTEAEQRTVLMSPWAASVLREQRTRSGGVGLVFLSTAGTRPNEANVRQRASGRLNEAQAPYREL